MDTARRSTLREVATITAVGLGFLTVLLGPAAQPALAQGTRLRVTASDLVPPETKGLLVSWEADALVLNPEDLTETVTLPFSSVTCLEQYTGQTKAGGRVVGGVLAGALWIAIVRRQATSRRRRARGLRSSRLQDPLQNGADSKA